MAKKIDSLDEIFEDKYREHYGETYEYDEELYHQCPHCEGKGFTIDSEELTREYGLDPSYLSNRKSTCGQCEGAGLEKYQVVYGVGAPQWSRQGIPKRYSGRKGKPEGQCFLPGPHKGTYD